MRVVADNRLRRLTFHLLFTLPLIILSCFSVMVIHGLYRLSHFNHSVIAMDVERYLNSRESSKSYGPEAGLRKMESSRGKKVLVLGGSSLLWSDGNKVFSEHIEEYLKSEFADVNVCNLGVNGYDSYGVLNRFREALKRLEQQKETPEAIVLYSGHNDFINTFRMSVYLPARVPVIKSVMLPFFLYHGLPKNRNNMEFHPSCFAGSFGPHFLRQMQIMSAISIPATPFRKYKTMILRGLNRNIGEICDISSKRNIPVILSTLICNLDMEPFGNIKTCHLYNDGLIEKNREMRLIKLKEAKNLEFYTTDVRAGSDTNRLIRGMAGPGVSVVDAEKLLLDKGFRMGNNEFTDYVHMRMRVHKLLGYALGAEIKRFISP